MIRSLWIAKTGMEAQQTQLDVIANNLANVSTNGFKKSRAVFEDLMYQNVRQPGAQSSQQTQLPSGLQIGTGVRRSPPSASYPGQPAADQQHAGHRDPGQRLPPGPDARRHHRYTRDGSLQIDAQGQLVTANGYAVQPAITIPSNAHQRHDRQRRHRHGDARRAGARRTQVGQIQLATFINPAGLEQGREPVRRDRASGTPHAGTPGTNGLGTSSRASSRPPTSTWSRSWSR